MKGQVATAAQRVARGALVVELASVALQEDQTVSLQVAQAFYSSSEPVTLTVAQQLVIMAQPNKNITQQEAQTVAQVMVCREKIVNVAQQKARIVAALVARGMKANIAHQESMRRVRDAQVEVARVA